MEQGNHKDKKKQRTLRQNNSLHKYCTEVAALLNESGIPLEVFYKNIEADYTMESIKELWRSFARAKYGKKSTTEFTTKEMNEIFDEVNRHLAQFGIHQDWPSEESLANKELIASPQLSPREKMDSMKLGNGRFGDIKSMLDRLNSGGKTANDLADELENLQKKGFKVRLR